MKKLEKLEKFLPGTGAVFLFLIVVMFLLTGCAGSSGMLKSNRALVEQYKEKALPVGYTYYYCGRSTLPYAVVGIDAAYGFRTRFWFKIVSEQEVYKKISNLSDLHIDSYPLSGSDILDGQGKKIGVWFSRYRSSPVRVDPKTRQVEVFNPYHPDEDRQGDW